MEPPARANADSILTLYAVALLVLPSVYTIGSFSLTAAMLVAMLAGLVWANGLAQGAHTALVSTPAGWGLLGFSFTLLVGYVVAMVSPMAPNVVSAADRRLVGAAAAIAAALLAMDGLTSRQALGRVERAIVYAAATMAAIGIVQYTTAWDPATFLRMPGFGSGGARGFVFNRQGLTRVAGTARHPIEFGIACAVVLPLAIHSAGAAPRRGQRRASALAAVLFVVAIPMSLSRASLLSLTAVVIAMFVMENPRHRRNMALAGLAVLGGFAVLLPGLLETSRNLFTTDLATASDQARLRSGEVAYEQFSSAPVLGDGLGSLQGLIVDNQYLVTLAETGLLGMAGLVALGGGAVLSLTAARRATADPQLRRLAASLIATISGLVVGAAGLSILSQGMLAGLTVFVVGLAGAVHRLAQEHSGVEPLTPVATDGDSGSDRIVLEATDA